MKRMLYCLIFGLILSGCTPSMEQESEKKVMNFGREVNVNRKGDLYTVSPLKISQVLPLRGNMPPLNKPAFVSAEEADLFLEGGDEIIGLNLGETVKAYPVKIMRWHLLANDHAGDMPLLMTYDPISKLGLAYKRTALEETINLQASDKMYNCNPLLRDAETKSYWSQFMGESIMGRLAGVKLEELAVTVTSWEGWKSQFPETEVLSIKTGFNKDYESNVYKGYYKSDRLLFEVENEDSRLHSKKMVYGLEVDGKTKAYLADILAGDVELTDNIAGVEIKITSNKKGIVSALRKESGENILVRRLFWFAWAAFHPETEIYQSSK